MRPGAQIRFQFLPFWNRDHKLGISMHALLPLYKAAKDAFMDAIGQYKPCIWG
uniref:Uncharacterized protein n=1 Tax=Manihot esculenta TaxID=3983 RepID=A0A2C9UWY2_MANES